MTEKQKSYIDWICRMLKIKFTGKTKKDAWEFIDKYKDEAHDIQASIHNDSGYYDDWDYSMYPDEGYFC